MTIKEHLLRNISNSFPGHIFSTVLPLYPGTGFPACPGGGVVEFPKPMQEAVIAEPDSIKRTHISSVKVSFKFHSIY